MNHNTISKKLAERSAVGVYNLILPKKLYFSTKPWKCVPHVFMSQFFLSCKTITFLEQKMREKGKLPCLDFFPQVKWVKKKNIHTHLQWEGFFKIMFSIILEDSNYLTWHTKNFLLKNDLIIRNKSFYSKYVFNIRQK